MQEKVQKYVQSLQKIASKLPQDQRDSLVNDYVISLSLYLVNIMLAIRSTELQNENNGFLSLNEYDVDEDSQKVIIPFSKPKIELYHYQAIMSIQDLTDNVIQRLSCHFDGMKDECYRCMLICPQKSPMAIVIPETSMMSQKAKLYKLSLEDAMKEFEYNFKRIVKEKS